MRSNNWMIQHRDGTFAPGSNHKSKALTIQHYINAIRPSWFPPHTYGRRLAGSLGHNPYDFWGRCRLSGDRAVKVKIDVELNGTNRPNR